MSEIGETVQLRDLAAKVPQSFTDGDWVEAPHIQDSGIRLIQTGNIGLGCFIDASKKYISQSSFDALKCKEVYPGDVLICRLAEPIGRSCFAPNLGERMITSVDVTILRVDTEAFEPRFIVYSLNTPESLRRCEIVSGGTTRQRISRSNLGRVELSVPERTVQRRIAEILSTLDETIEQTEALIAKYQQIKAGLMHDLFTRGVTGDGKLRPARTEAPQLYKESPLGWIPKEWEVKPLSDLSQLITSGSRGWAEYYSDSGPLFLRISNLTREHINFRWEEVTRVRLPKSSEGQRTAIRPNDILISITADLGIIAVAHDDLGEAYVNQHIALVRPRVEPVLSRFIGHCLSTVRVQKQFLRLNDSGAKAGLNLPAVGKILVTKPVDDLEAKRIATMLDEADQSVECYKREAEKLRQQKHGLMHDLLTGRVRVKVA